MNADERPMSADERIERFIAAPGVHHWAKEVLMNALRRDIVDSLNGLDAVVKLLEAKFQEMHETKSPIVVLDHKEMPSKVRQSLWSFVSRLSGIPEVIEVKYLEGEWCITVWVVVTTSLTNYEGISPIYDAVMRAMKDAEMPNLDCCVVRAYKGRSPYGLIPSAAKTLWPVKI